MKEKLEQKVERVLEGICPGCETKSILKYIGPIIKGHPESGHLYNCQKCRTSISLATYLEFNQRKPTSSSQ